MPDSATVVVQYIMLDDVANASPCSERIMPGKILLLFDAPKAPDSANAAVFENRALSKPKKVPASDMDAIEETAALFDAAVAPPAVTDMDTE